MKCPIICPNKYPITDSKIKDTIKIKRKLMKQLIRMDGYIQAIQGDGIRMEH